MSGDSAGVASVGRNSRFVHSVAASDRQRNRGSDHEAANGSAPITNEPVSILPWVQSSARVHHSSMQVPPYLPNMPRSPPSNTLSQQTASAARNPCRNERFCRHVPVSAERGTHVTHSHQECHQQSSTGYYCCRQTP